MFLDRARLWLFVACVAPWGDVLAQTVDERKKAEEKASADKVMAENAAAAAATAKAAAEAADAAVSAASVARRVAAAAGGYAPGWIPELEVAAAGGFVGVSQVQVQRAPSVTCRPSTPPLPATCTTDPNEIELVKVKTEDWRPAVSTGLVLRWKFRRSRSEDSLGAGFGGHFVFVPGNDGASRPAPALTFHLGKSGTQLFFGWVYVPTDDVSQVPAGRFPAIFDETSLIRRNATKTGSFFAGVVVGGVPILKP